MALLDNWPQIMGSKLAEICTPFKITWPRSSAGEKKPATLSIACEGMVSLKIQHQVDEILEKINLFFGFHAIGQIKIIQKSLSHRPDIVPPMRVLSQAEQTWLKQQSCVFEDEALRHAITRLGENIMATTSIVSAREHLKVDTREKTNDNKNHMP